MKTTNISFIIFIILLSSCSANTIEKQIEPFGQNQKILVEKIPIKEVIDPSFMMIKGKNLFVANTKNDSLLFQYSLPELQLLYKGGIKGQAPDEFQLFPMFCKTQSESVYIWGYTPFNIKRFSLGKDQNLTFKENFFLDKYESFNQMHIIKDSILIYSAIPDEFAIKKVNLKNQKEIGQISFKTDDHPEAFFYKNRGLLAVNDSFIVYTYIYKKQIDIYSTHDLKLLYRLSDHDAPVNIQIGDFENSTNYYINVIAGKKYFYALCQGEKKDNKLEVFDYNGHSIMEYEFNITPYLFEVDEANHCLYGYNNECEDYFLKYKLEPF